MESAAFGVREVVTLVVCDEVENGTFGELWSARREPAALLIPTDGHEGRQARIGWVWCVATNPVENSSKTIATMTPGSAYYIHHRWRCS